MQFDQRPTMVRSFERPPVSPGTNQQIDTMTGRNNGYSQLQDKDIEAVKHRSRRQFLITAGGLVMGTALFVGGEFLLLRGNPAALFNNTANTPGSSPTNTLSPAHPVKLAVGQAGNAISFFPFYVAQQLGYFQSHGLDIGNVISLPTGAKVAAAVKDGTLEIGNGVITDAYSLATTDSTVRIIGALMNAYTADVVVSKAFVLNTGISPTSPLADKINALQGKKIGITGPGSGTQALLTYLFRLQGLNAEQAAQQVALGANNATALAALRAGQIDALSFFVPIGQQAEAAGIGDIFISPVHGDVPQLVGDVHGIFYTKQNIIDTKPQAVAAYIKAMAQAAAYIQNNPTQAKEYLAKYLKVSADIASTVYTAASPYIAKNPQISQAAYTIAGNFHVKAGLVSIIPSYGQMVASSTIDSAMTQS